MYEFYSLVQIFHSFSVFVRCGAPYRCTPLIFQRWLENQYQKQQQQKPFHMELAHNIVHTDNEYAKIAKHL